MRSFADSDGDGVGDLKGLTARLDYLNDGNPSTTSDLGVGAIWLMPIFPSPSYHGYDVTDYRAVNPAYGSLADLDALVAAAHQRGIRVILDMVLNHSSSAHPWFANSVVGPAAARRDWYVWRDTDPGWAGPTGAAHAWTLANGAYYYSAFTSGMPDLNLRNAAVEQELVDGMKFWLARGVDGFRLDAVRYLDENGPGLGLVDQPETHAFLKRVRASLDQDYPGALLVGEAWAPMETVASYSGAGDELQLAFAFDMAGALLGSGVAADASAVINTVARTETVLAGKDRRFDAPFLSNHDQVRTMRQLAGDAAAARVVAATLMALPGTPFVYYGEEIGMQGGASSATSDPDKRTPFHWTSTGPGYGFTTGSPWRTSGGEAAGVDVASQQPDPASLWNLYRRVIAVRNGQAALTGAEASRPAVSGGGAGVLALLRGAGSERVLFVANYGTAATASFTVAVPGASSAALLESEGLAGAPSAAAGVVTFPGLAARAFAFLKLT